MKLPRVSSSIKTSKNNLPKAIELDRAIKIGWGAQGDAKPQKEGEIGIATHLPHGSKNFRLFGNLGDFTARVAMVAHSLLKECLRRVLVHSPPRATRN
ncbi:MAG: hypothetical protein Ct9H90mP16_01750 [Candidatus Poseidoniales archaeon]|nr:MAG: hypothetical protein Ct9H90mP16_01750 [Candidatus Poseidoniales archaeon]